MPNSLILVCDDAGYECIDRGILALAERTGAPLCADYLITQDGAADRARAMSRVPSVSVGLHFELADMPDAKRVALSRELAKGGSSLGEQEDIRRMATRDAKRQLGVFRETLGMEPSHISTHGNFNADVHDCVLPWWTELMQELFDGKVPPMQLAVPHIRHNLYGWNLPGTEHRPLTPGQFGEKLRAYDGCDYIEFVMHPALPKSGDPSIDMLFTEKMRIADLDAAAGIMSSGVIERSGFTVVPVTALAW